jgi:tetratricopeptide (TPR) repeat protein
MTGVPRDLQRQRDEALRDLIDLERQVAEGEITPEDAASLRHQYETEAVAALQELEQNVRSQASRDEKSSDRTTVRRTARGVLSRRVLYGVGLATAVLAAVLVPQFIVDRPPGGYVTGNEVLQQPGGSASSGAAPPADDSRDLSKVTNQELEAVVNANPKVVGMRLALARRYAAASRFDLAVVHYSKVLEQEPKNAQAQVGLSWILLQLDELEDARELVDQALANDPQLLEAMWVQANILLYGVDDPQGATKMLDKILTRADLQPGVRRQAQQLRSVATAREEGDP